MLTVEQLFLNKMCLLIYLTNSVVVARGTIEKRKRCSLVNINGERLFLFSIFRNGIKKTTNDDKITNNLLLLFVNIRLVLL